MIALHIWTQNMTLRFTMRICQCLKFYIQMGSFSYLSLGRGSQGRCHLTILVEAGHGAEGGNDNIREAEEKQKCGLG